MMGSIRIDEAYADSYLPQFDKPLVQHGPETIAAGEKERVPRVQEVGRWMREELGEP